MWQLRTDGSIVDDLMSTTAVNIAEHSIFSSKSSDKLTKQLDFLLMVIANMNSETSLTPTLWATADLILLESTVFLDQYM